MLLGYTFRRETPEKRTEYRETPVTRETAEVPALEAPSEEGTGTLPVAERMLRAAMDAIRVPFPQAFQTAVDAMRVIHEGLAPEST